MAELGKLNRLQVVKQVPFGVYLDGEDLGTILLPSRYVPKDCVLGDWLEVFIYLDSEDIPIATTEKPYAMVGECAYLKVVAVTEVGAFLDWGLPKDLLVPYSEQSKPMQVGRSYVVNIYLDASDRIAASTKLSKYLREESTSLAPKQAVDLLISGRTDMGYKAVINNSHLGLIHHNDAITPLKPGQKLKGYIKAIRVDGRIDLCLQLTDQEARDALSSKILEYLQAHGGISTLTDKSPPEAIYKQFGVSKASYKKALGRLYKQKLIFLDKEKITLV